MNIYIMMNSDVWDIHKHNDHFFHRIRHSKLLYTMQIKQAIQTSEQYSPCNMLNSILVDVVIV